MHLQSEILKKKKKIIFNINDKILYLKKKITMELMKSSKLG